MSDEGAIVTVRASVVRCRGEEGSHHPEVRLRLPERDSACCPVCGRRYRRDAGWSGLSEAVWPKPR